MLPFEVELPIKMFSETQVEPVVLLEKKDKYSPEKLKIK